MSKTIVEGLKREIISAVANDYHESLKNEPPYFNMTFDELGAVCRDLATKDVNDLISQEALKGQIKEVKDMYSWAGDNFVPRSRLRLRLSELKDLLKKEEL